MAIFDFANSEREMQLVSLHPNITLDQVKAEIGWDIRLADSIDQTPAPTAEELRLAREELDPEGIYRK
jgi:glutaconate CoA-transferase subunit B